MEIRKVVPFIPLIQEQNRDIKRPSRHRHPACITSQFRNRIISRDDKHNLEDTVAVHKVEVDGREGEEEVGPDERLLRGFEAVGGFGGDKEGSKEMAEGDVDRDDD